MNVADQIVGSGFSSTELRNKAEGDCRYVTRMTSCSDIKGLLCSQIFEQKLPDVSHPELVTSSKPLTKTILLRNDDFLFGAF